MDLSKIPEPSEEITMSDEVWWAKRWYSWVDFYTDKASAERVSGIGMVRSFSMADWIGVFDGPDMKHGEIIPIRPLRIERVEVRK